MSWSISMSGCKELIQKELTDAKKLIDLTLERIENSKLNQISVNLGGHISWNDQNDIIADGFSLNVGTSDFPKK